MQANKRSLDAIFSPSIRLVAPLFQRPYVWNRDNNWLPLWESIRDVTERRLQGETSRPHFLGAVVLNQLHSATGAIDTREIIDGQQRLTTLQILITVLHDLSKHFKIKNYAKLFSPWIKNPLEDETKSDDLFKAWPTNADREQFKRVMQAGNLFAIYHTYRGGTPPSNTPNGFGANDDPEVQAYLCRRAGLSHEERNIGYGQLSKTQQKEVDLHTSGLDKIHGLIPNAYLYFYAVLIEWLGDPDSSEFPTQMSALYQTMKQDLVLVIIDLDDKQDDAQQIFETMNALGTPLLPADLVKNFLFRAADQQGVSVDQLYAKYWQVFDDKTYGWRDEVRQGRLKRSRIDLFLQHYLALMTGEEILVTDLFTTYRKWAFSKNQPADQHVAHFRRYADIYWRFDHFPAHSREALFFTRMSQIDTTTVFPLMLEVFSRHTAPGADKATREIMIDLESYLIRRSICGLTTKNYNRFFRTLVQHLTTTNDFTPATIRQFLLKQTADATLWPDDTMFRQAWLERPLYKQQVQQRTRMILEALELQLHSSLTNAHTITGSVSIEHFMPQSWQAHWQPPQGIDLDEATRKRNILIHTMGNLTILSKSLNPTLSNGSWSTKLPEIMRNNALILNQNLPTTWDEQAILTRGKKLFDEAIVIWPYPS